MRIPKFVQRFVVSKVAHSVAKAAASHLGVGFLFPDDAKPEEPHGPSLGAKVSAFAALSGSVYWLSKTIFDLRRAVHACEEREEEFKARLDALADDVDALRTRIVKLNETLSAITKNGSA